MKRTYKVVHDEDAPNPRKEFDCFGKMVCFHRRYDLGDKHDLKAEDFNGWDELEAYLKEDLKAAVVLPLYLYDHSGITINTTGFSCPWDSGQVGFTYATEGRDFKIHPDWPQKGNNKMSHVTTVQTEIKDKTALMMACKQLGLQFRTGKHTVKSYSGSVECNFSFNLPGWRYPVAMLDDGTLKFDTFNGHWGDSKELDKLKQTYGVEVATKKAKSMGYLVQKKVKQDGTIQLTLSK